VVTVHHYTDGGGQQPRQAPLITDARPGTSADISQRQKRYIITMTFRTACFLAMIFVSGPLRWVLFGCALILPYVAVVFANQANRKRTSNMVDPAGPDGARQLTTGPDQVIKDEGVRGERAPGDEAPPESRRVA
jgi:hypothetical protein